MIKLFPHQVEMEICQKLGGLLISLTLLVKYKEFLMSDVTAGVGGMNLTCKERTLQNITVSLQFATTGKTKYAKAMSNTYNY